MSCINIKNNLAIIIPTYNAENFILECINSIKLNYNNKFNTYIVDGGSTDRTLEIIQKQKFKKVVIFKKSKNIGYAGLINYAINKTEFTYYLVVNPDTIFLNNTIYPMYDLIKNERKIGLVGCQQLFINKGHQRSFDNFPSIFDTLFMIFGKLIFFRIICNIKNFFLKSYRVPYIDGACMLISKNAFKKLNGFDENYFFYSEEVDFCYRLKKFNYKVVFTNISQIIHLRGGSSTKRKIKIKYLRLLVDNKSKFYGKYHNFWMTKIYIILNYFYNFQMYMIYSLLFFLLKKNLYKFKYKYFFVLKSLWFLKY
jgi:GT2 family glycosyltransferase